MKDSVTHITNLWALYIVKTLLRGGVRDFCIAPGSRNAPLTLALAELKQQSLREASNQEIVLHTHFDERGLAFYALGICKSTNKPVAIITTSGTAVPNLHPAVVESFQTHAPLIVLTADRPPELLSCGANQSINQQNIFGQNVVHYLQLDAPSQSTPLQKVVDDINLCIKYAMGAVEATDPGPVHINCPFREPLYGNSDLRDHAQYIEELNDITPASAPSEIESVRPITEVNWNSTGIIIAASLSSNDSEYVLALSHLTGWPILADICSQLRLNKDARILHYTDLLIANKTALSILNEAKQVIQFGGRITSKRLNQWLGNFSGKYILIGPHYEKLDPHHKANQYRTPIQQYCAQVNSRASFSPMAEKLAIINKQIGRCISDALSQEFNELSIARSLSIAIPEGMPIFTGNSLAIRLVDMFSSPTHGNPVYSNRGASGIDGLLATAVGCGQYYEKGLTLLIGDLSLLHDLNSLALASKQTKPFVIVVLNNDGGSIFNLLPVDDMSEVKETFFQCPHGLNFKDVCRMFSITYFQPKTLDNFETDYLAASKQNYCSLIEITVPSEQATSRIKKTGASGFNPIMLRTQGNPNDPPIVLLHGFLGSQHDWDVIIRALSPHWYCITPDLPGHGEHRHNRISPNAETELEQIFKEILGCVNKPFHLIGYSLGGRLAMRLAHNFPDRILSLCLESSHPGLLDQSARLARTKSDTKWAERFRNEPLKNVLRDWYRQPVFNCNDENQLNILVGKHLTQSPVAIADTLTLFGLGIQKPYWDFLAQWSKPLLYISGENDVKFTTIGGTIKNNSKHAEHIKIENTAHNCHLDQPKQFIDAITYHLNNSA